MASIIYSYKTATGEVVKAARKKQGRHKSIDPMIPITVRIPASWLADMGEDKRHYIRVAIYEKRTRNLVKQ